MNRKTVDYKPRLVSLLEVVVRGRKWRGGGGWRMGGGEGGVDWIKRDIRGGNIREVGEDERLRGVEVSPKH